MEIKKLTKEEYLKRLPEITNLFEICFGKRTTQEFLKWRYLENGSKDLLVYVAIDQNKIIANYSASPLTLLIKNVPVKCALSMTTMTHPEYSGRGLFTTLASKLYEELKSMDYDLILGFPNNNSHRGFISKLEWKDIYEIPTMRLNLNLAKKSINRSDLLIKRDNEFKLNYTNDSNTDLIRVNKERDYLQWRYFRNPVNSYENLVIENNDTVSSFLIFKTFNNKEIDIVDYSFQATDEAEGLLEHLISESKELGVTIINSWAPRHISFHSLLEKKGFINQEPITYFGKRDLTGKAISDSFSNWVITMGDSDVY